MHDSYDVLVVGAGPGGLSAARLCAEQGMRVLVIERRSKIGPKVCAGGITWSGLIKRVPETLIEGAFPCQHLFSRRQRAVITRNQPIIATVSRTRLGEWMLRQAQQAGAEVVVATSLAHFQGGQAVLDHDGKNRTVRFSWLVGADGANSTVRRLLGIESQVMGLGLNCQLQGQRERMEWHLNHAIFGTGYGWLFPHRQTFSIGAYADSSRFDARLLKTRLIRWAWKLGVDLSRADMRAGMVNSDFRGYRFGRVWLVGDAAGLASALTGEGIYPAIVSGEEVARCILDDNHRPLPLEGLIRRHQRHGRLLKIAGRSPATCTALMETAIFLMRLRILDFKSLEMAE